jgi:hypothetical protein
VAWDNGTFLDVNSNVLTKQQVNVGKPTGQVILKKIFYYFCLPLIFLFLFFTRPQPPPLIGLQTQPTTLYHFITNPAIIYYYIL